MSQEGKKKSNILGSIITAIVISAVFISLFLWYSHSEKVVEQANAIQDCKIAGHSRLSSQGIIPKETRFETVKSNCETIENRIHVILDNYNAKWFPVYVTGHLVTDCGDYSTGCVTSRHTGIAKSLPGIIPPVMTISYTADYDFGLEHTVTHEYVHTLTSGKEGEYLEANPQIWGGVDPLEGVADCGINYFMPGEFKGGSYMGECTTEQTEIANAVIEDTLIK